MLDLAVGPPPALARENMTHMTDQPTPPAPARKTGLSPREQKLQALREKAAHASSGAKPAPGASAAGFKAKNSFTGKKTAFQRKAT